MRQLIWFRSDLRVRDNTALTHAMQAGPTLALYLISVFSLARPAMVGDAPRALQVLAQLRQCVLRQRLRFLGARVLRGIFDHRDHLLVVHHHHVDVGAVEIRTGLALQVRGRGGIGRGRRRIGLHPLERADEIFDLKWCHITSETVWFMAVWSSTIILA